MGFHGTFAQYTNILMCPDRGTVSKRPLGEALSFHANFFAFLDQFLQLIRGHHGLSWTQYLHSKVARLEESLQWESKGDEDLPWDNL